MHCSRYWARGFNPVPANSNLFAGLESGRTTQLAELQTSNPSHPSRGCAYNPKANVLIPVPITTETIHKIKEEIEKLTEQQNEALQSATYLGMTTDEAKEYEERRDRILSLVESPALLEESQ